MTVRVFLAVEGPNDGGALGKSPQARANDPDNEGALQPLVRRLAGDTVEIRGQKTTMLPLGGLSDPEHAIGRRARQAATLAALDGCDVLVVHVDVDDAQLGTGAADAWASVADLVEDGFGAARAAGEILDEGTVACVPCRTIEAWLLADHDEVRAAADDDAATPERSIADPEALWGENLAGTNHPKHVLRRALRPTRPRAATRDYARVAANADLGVLAARCPASFPPFRDAFRAATDAVRAKNPAG